MKALASLKNTLASAHNIDEGLFTFMYILDNLYKNSKDKGIKILRDQLHSWGLPDLAWESLLAASKKSGYPMPEWLTKDLFEQELKRFRESLVSMKHCLDLAYAGNKEEAVKHLRKILDELGIPKLEHFKSLALLQDRPVPSWLAEAAATMAPA